MSFGTLYLVPNLIASGDPAKALAPDVVERIRSLRHFIAEGERSAWRLLSALMDKEALAETRMELLNEHSLAEDLPRIIAPLLEGKDIGLLSEAGMPCVADPGSALAALAHERSIRVVPLAGPSSILLALAASGMDGQSFIFLGYLPQQPEARRRALEDIDRKVQRDGATRLFIETPYRNDRLLEDCLSVLSESARLCVARGLGSGTELIRSWPIGRWKAEMAAARAGRPPTDGEKAPGMIGKEPAIFLVGRTSGMNLDRAAPLGHSATPRCRRRKR